MRMLLAVAVLGGLASPALAQYRPSIWQEDAKPQMTHYRPERVQAERPPVYDVVRERPALPIRAEVQLRMQNGDFRDDSARSFVRPDAQQKPAGYEKGAFQNPPLTPDQREKLCQWAGVCIAQKTSSDSVEDKTK